jgi:hypothetical protein
MIGQNDPLQSLGVNAADEVGSGNETAAGVLLGVTVHLDEHERSFFGGLARTQALRLHCTRR